MIKTSKPIELMPAEKSVVTKNINRCLELQRLKDSYDEEVRSCKKTIRTLMGKAHLDRCESEQGYAQIIHKEQRSFDVGLIADIVDPEDLDVIAPRKIDAERFDEVISHHRYDSLDKAVVVKQTTAFEVRPL